jgi:N-acetyltransferase
MDFDFSKEIVLQNAVALLRPLRPEDSASLIAVATAHNDLVLFSPYTIHTPELLAQYIQSSLNDKENGIRYPFAIYDKQKEAWAGSTSIANVSNRDKRLEIGWTWIGKAFQQTGLNRATKFLLLSYAFEDLQFERVEFKTDARNQASRTAIEKIGGRYEGALRSHTLMPDGFRRTTVYYSILQEEWPRLKETVFKIYNTS